jgi:hypothetical protein
MSWPPRGQGRAAVPDAGLPRRRGLDRRRRERRRHGRRRRPRCITRSPGSTEHRSGPDAGLRPTTTRSAAAACPIRNGSGKSRFERHSTRLRVPAASSKTAWARLRSFRIDPGDLVMHLGRPVLVVPPGLDHLDVRRVAVGWKNASTRAREVALPPVSLRIAVASMSWACRNPTTSAVSSALSPSSIETTTRPWPPARMGLRRRHPRPPGRRTRLLPDEPLNAASGPESLERFPTKRTPVRRKKAC